MLFSYMQDTQRLIRDSRQKIIDPQDLIIYVNKARRETAMRGECARFLTPVSGDIGSISVTASGSGYSSATVSLSAPDFPAGTPNYPSGLKATATATVSSGTVASISITNPGAGYFEPVVTITGNGSGATATAVVNDINETILGQEVYPFSSVNLSGFPGAASIFQVKSVSFIYSNYRYSLPVYSFTTYQAMIRQFPFQYQYVPTVAAQFGQGTAGSFFMYPLPSQVYQMEWDSLCLPSDLALDSDPEIIPQPWTDAVPYFAAYLAFLEMQNFNSARAMQAEYDQFMHRYGYYTRPGRQTNPYGRW